MKSHCVDILPQRTVYNKSFHKKKGKAGDTMTTVHEWLEETAQYYQTAS